MAVCLLSSQQVAGEVVVFAHSAEAHWQTYGALPDHHQPWGDPGWVVHFASGLEVQYLHEKVAPRLQNHAACRCSGQQAGVVGAVSHSRLPFWLALHLCFCLGYHSIVYHHQKCSRTSFAVGPHSLEALPELRVCSDYHPWFHLDQAVFVVPEWNCSGLDSKKRMPAA